MRVCYIIIVLGFNQKGFKIMEYKELKQALTDICEKNIPNIPNGMYLKNLNMSLEDISGEKYTISLELFSNEYKVLETTKIQSNNKMFSNSHQ